MANDVQNPVKMSGYLEKKGKMVISSWKKYWFVLEGRLLLYYRSKDEYDAISPFKGSISLRSPCKIKPAQASTCVFQIETRSSSITLRAESRFEQERWMQAILSALNQFSSNSPNNRMSHFRYSFDDLSPTVETQANDQLQKKRSTLVRQNTMPDRGTSSLTQTTQDMVQRIQNIGGVTYCQDIASRLSDTSTKRESNTKHESKTRSSSLEMMKENNLYVSSHDLHQPSNSSSLSSKENLSSKGLDSKTDSKVSSNSEISRENNLYVSANELYEMRKSTSLSSRENVCLHNRKDAESNTECKVSSRNSEMLEENNLYSSTNEHRQLNKSTSLSAKDSFNPKDVMMENNHYFSYNSVAKGSNNNPAQPQVETNVGKTRHESINEENFKEESSYVYDTNDDVMLRDVCYQKEHFYERISDGSIESADDNGMPTKTSKILRQSEEGEYCSVNERLSSDSSHCEQPSDAITDNIYHIPHQIDYNKNTLLVNNDTYISNGEYPETEYAEYAAPDAIPEDETIYEEPDKVMSRKVKEDKRKQKHGSFIRRMFKWKRKSNEKLEKSKDCKVINKDNQEELLQNLEVLSQLQKILDTKKCEIEEKIKIKQTQETNISPTISLEDNAAETDKALKPTEFTEEQRKKPPSPPKKQKRKSNGDDSNNKQEKLKTIDEILEDLDKEKKVQDSKVKVKELINKFEQDIDPAERVLLRQKSPITLRKMNEVEKKFRYSDELTHLLDELAKVTNAPVMAPGVTSSLVTRKLSDDEWLKLIPLRCRRKCDPDYDIPRPHRSLQLLTKKDPKTSLMLQGEGNVFDSIINNMTPDSLEVENIRPIIRETNNLKTGFKNFDRRIVQSAPDGNLISSKQEVSEKAEEVIYARPRSIIPNYNPVGDNDTSKNKDNNSTINSSYRTQTEAELGDYTNVQQYFRVPPIYEEGGIKSLDVFVDSLEPFSETSTLF